MHKLRNNLRLLKLYLDETLMKQYKNMLEKELNTS